ncbi:hypothetical protein CRG98_046755 [Punica granatum]|uniref:Uncharacterized protein n=1 Tax=Punica granatum TaxID=22663 RepID=A0A2I0HNK4_PUNGR|nr:hypothetical protein CRG98_046755 [Punica granatum]
MGGGQIIVQHRPQKESGRFYMWAEPYKTYPLSSSHPTTFEIHPFDPTALQTLPSVFNSLLSNRAGRWGQSSRRSWTGIMTFEWVLCTSTLRAATTVIASLLGLNQDVLPWASLAITIALVFVLIIIFEVISGAVGGPSSTPPPQRRSMWISRGCWTGTRRVE